MKFDLIPNHPILKKYECTLFNKIQYSQCISTHMHLIKTNQDVVGEINDEMLFS